MRCKPGLKVSPKAEKQKWYIFVNGIIFSLDFFLYRLCEEWLHLAGKRRSNLRFRCKKMRLLLPQLQDLNDSSLKLPNKIKIIFNRIYFQS